MMSSPLLTHQGLLDVYSLEQIAHMPEAQKTWEDINCRAGDVYYDIPYLQANAVHEEGQTKLCLYRHPDGYVIYPFVLRSLTQLPFEANIPGASYDMISPFEYGGPLVDAAEPRLRESLCECFCQTFSEYCQSIGIVSEFARLHPILQGADAWSPFYTVQSMREHVIVDLRKNSDQLFSEYSRTGRRDVNLAVRRGIHVESASKTRENVRKFMEIYSKTMDHRQALSFYYFHPAYFERLADIGDSRVSLYFAHTPDGTAVSTAFILHGEKYAHYHLGGTVRGLAQLPAGELLLHTVIMDMRRRGKLILHLGGAAADQPGLFRFKSKFSSDRKNYFIASKIHDPVAYDTLCRGAARVRSSQGVQHSVNFFPSYRA